MLKTCYFIEVVHKRLLVTEISLSMFSGETHGTINIEQLRHQPCQMTPSNVNG